MRKLKTAEQAEPDVRPTKEVARNGTSSTTKPAKGDQK